MILACATLDPILSSITRTCGGDPQIKFAIKLGIGVLPAHAGVILVIYHVYRHNECITRTCGGDPGDIRVNSAFTMYYPHMRG